MCGRFVQRPLPLAFADADAYPEIGADLRELTPRYNLAPTQRAGVILRDEDDLQVRRLIWRLIPHHADNLKFKYSTINARAETVAKSWSFRYAFRERRCLVPMAGYYEWQGAAGAKQPYYLHRANDEPLFAAGIWEPRQKIQPPDDPGSFAIITTDARDEYGRVHERMPVFLPFASLEDWTTATVDDAQAMLAAFQPPPIEIYPVSRAVNGPKLDDPSLILPIPAEEAIA